MGMDLEYPEGGPVLHNPVREARDVERLEEAEPRESLGFVYEAVRKTREQMNPALPLIGFCGAPFTLASYMIEGGGSRNFENTKRFMYADPGAWHALMEKLVRGLSVYLNEQIRAGAQAVQIFDSWVGCLSPGDFREFRPAAQPRADRGNRKKKGAPVIHFGTGTAAYLEAFAGAGGDVAGVDFRVELADARERLGDMGGAGKPRPVRPVRGRLNISWSGRRTSCARGVCVRATYSTWGTGYCRARRSRTSRDSSGSFRNGKRGPNEGQVRFHRHDRLRRPHAGLLPPIRGMPGRGVLLRGGHRGAERSGGPERIREVAAHYEYFGGVSPFTFFSQKQAGALEMALERAGEGVPVYTGYRFWTPYVEETLAEMGRRGLRRALGVVLAPHRTKISWEAYRGAVASAREELGEGAPEVEFSKNPGTSIGLHRRRRRADEASPPRREWPGRGESHLYGALHPRFHGQGLFL